MDGTYVFEGGSSSCMLLTTGHTLFFYVNTFSLRVLYGSRQSPQDASMHALIC